MLQPQAVSKPPHCQLVALPEGPGAEAVCEALAQSIATLPAQLRPPLTWDQGSEMSEHRRFSVGSGVEVYFCDSRSPQDPEAEAVAG